MKIIMGLSLGAIFIQFSAAAQIPDGWYPFQPEETLPTVFINTRQQAIQALQSEQSDNKAGKIASSKGELTWHYQVKGYVTIQTRNTADIIGFSGGKTMDTEALSLTSHTSFSVMLVTNAEQNGTLASSERWLIAAVARTRNTGMQYNASSDTLIAPGSSSILQESVDFFIDNESSGKGRIVCIGSQWQPNQSETSCIIWRDYLPWSCAEIPVLQINL